MTAQSKTGLGWMRTAACLEEPGLPWVGPPADDWHRVPDPIGEYVRMRQICTSCPARAACESYVQQAQVTAGFWAGRWRRDRREMLLRDRAA